MSDYTVIKLRQEKGGSVRRFVKKQNSASGWNDPELEGKRSLTAGQLLPGRQRRGGFIATDKFKFLVHSLSFCSPARASVRTDPHLMSRSPLSPPRWLNYRASYLSGVLLSDYKFDFERKTFLSAYPVGAVPPESLSSMTSLPFLLLYQFRPNTGADRVQL